MIEIHRFANSMRYLEVNAVTCCLLLFIMNLHLFDFPSLFVFDCLSVFQNILQSELLGAEKRKRGREEEG